MEDAVAALSSGVSLSPIASSAAHQLATIEADRCRVAQATTRTAESGDAVSLAEIRRTLIVDEISGVRLLVVWVGRKKLNSSAVSYII